MEQQRSSFPGAGFWLLFGVNSKLRKQREDFQSVALIVGLTCTSGNSLAEILPLSDTPGGPWKVYGVACRALPIWQSHHRVQHIQCNLSDPQDTQAKLSHLSDVTHIFYVESVNYFSEAENRAENMKMLRNFFNSVIPNAPNLRHVCLQKGLDSHEDAAFSRLDTPNSYYSMEDILLEHVQENNKLTWSVHRPSMILGFSPYSAGNIVGSLCVYATICKHEELPLRFPGSRAAWEGYSEAADADLLAKQQIWAAVESPGSGQTFSFSNGDTFRWKDLWKVLAEQFGVEFVEFEEGSSSLAEMMTGKAAVWDDIVEEKELLPTELEELGAWRYVDSVLRSEQALQDSSSCSMDRSRELGFSCTRDTVESFRDWIIRVKMDNIVP